MCKRRGVAERSTPKQYHKALNINTSTLFYTVVIEVQIPKYSPFKKSRLEQSHSDLKPKLKSPSKHPGRSKPPAAIASSPRRSTPQPMRGSSGGPPPGSMKLKAPSTPRSDRIAQTKGLGTPKRSTAASPGSSAKVFLPGQGIKVPKTPTEKEGDGSGVVECEFIYFIIN